MGGIKLIIPHPDCLGHMDNLETYKNCSDCDEATFNYCFNKTFKDIINEINEVTQK